MKILMMHRGDGDDGGGQVQMNRLYSGLRQQGIDARILCREKISSESVEMPYWPGVERWIEKFSKRAGLNDIHLVSSFGVPKLQEFVDADLIDFHCLHSGTFSYLALPAMTARKPAVFTFHDMWPITGHCHASLDCDRWKTGCGKCPHLDFEPAVRRDATAIEWKLKKRAYARSKFAIVTPSKWLYDRTAESMLGGFPLHHIPHGVEIDEFKPLDKDHCRSLLGIPKGKKVLICAMENMRRPLKGAQLLVQALEGLPESLKRDCVLVFFGHSSEEIIGQIDMPVMDLGYLHSKRLKAVAFSAADLLVSPSRAESFGLVILESMACGTPVVAFHVGGIPELVRPGITGFLARPDDPAHLGEGVSLLLGDAAGLAAMSQQCRRTVVEDYSLELQISRYIELYRKVISA